MFKIEDKAQSQLLYSNLIQSNELKLFRRKKLRKQYTSFSKHNLNSFWATHKLALERDKTRAHSAIIAVRTARLAQTASVFESSWAFAPIKVNRKVQLLTFVTSTRLATTATPNQLLMTLVPTQTVIF